MIQLIHVPNDQSASGNWQQQPDQSYNTWAEVSNPSGFRDYLNGQTQLGLTKRFQVRFQFDLFPGADWKVKYQGKEYTVQSIERLNEKRFYWTIRGTAK
jgi:SPP1 family predicted phage head-tail adaptor